jgi:hypothetical protein
MPDWKTVADETIEGELARPVLFRRRLLCVVFLSLGLDASLAILCMSEVPEPTEICDIIGKSLIMEGVKGCETMIGCNA